MHYESHTATISYSRYSFFFFLKWHFWPSPSLYFNSNDNFACFHCHIILLCKHFRSNQIQRNETFRQWKTFNALCKCDIIALAMLYFDIYAMDRVIEAIRFFLLFNRYCFSAMLICLKWEKIVWRIYFNG